MSSAAVAIISHCCARIAAVIFNTPTHVPVSSDDTLYCDDTLLPIKQCLVDALPRRKLVTRNWQAESITPTQTSVCETDTSFVGMHGDCVERLPH